MTYLGDSLNLMYYYIACSLFYWGSIISVIFYYRNYKNKYLWARKKVDGSIWRWYNILKKEEEFDQVHESNSLWFFFRVWDKKRKEFFHYDLPCLVAFYVLSLLFYYVQLLFMFLVFSHLSISLGALISKMRRS